MIQQPWLGDSHWEKKDPKLRQLEENPLRLPHLDEVLKKIPLEEGIFSILGPRQVGKSTLIHLLAKKALLKFLPQNLILIEGDALESWRELLSIVTDFVEREKKSTVFVFIDEITSIPEWPRAVKLLADRGHLKSVCFVYTGSSMVSLKEAGELFPGRRGRHSQTSFEVLPASYRLLKDHLTLDEYFIVGGFPWAINEYLRLKVVPDYVGEIYWSWIKGEFLKRGKSDLILKHMVQAMGKRVQTGFSQHTLAQEMGITSNETARQYMELLCNCFAVTEVPWIDPQKNLISPKKNRKYYPIDPLLFHLFLGGGSLSGIDPAKHLNPELAGKIAESVVCQELKREDAHLGYWSGKKEVDFVPHFIEVKYQNKVSPQEFYWFTKAFPAKTKLKVLTKNDQFQTDQIQGIPLKEWLLR